MSEKSYSHQLITSSQGPRARNGSPNWDPSNNPINDRGGRKCGPVFHRNSSEPDYSSEIHFSSNVYENGDNDEDNDGSAIVSSDDAEDEDWVASDYDKKRSNRGISSRNHLVASRKSNVNLSSYRRNTQKDRGPRKSGVSLMRPHQATAASRVNLKQAASKSATRSRDHIGTAISSFTNNRKSGRRTGKTDDKGKCSPKKKLQVPPELLKPRQCFGPGCTRAAARPDTKYCSDECGINLAMRRLEVLLPESLTAWCSDKMKNEENQTTENLSPLTNCMAELLDKQRLDEIHTEQCAVHNRLVELEMEHQNLTTLIARVQERKSDRNNQYMLAARAKDAEQVEQMEPVICVTCSTEISIKHALKHMEKCFQKMEGNTVFCASQKEQIIGTPLFCDAYDPQTRSYCKRLRVVCEHYKEPKLPPDTVCGSPLVRDVFIKTGEFCCVPRNKCTKHFGWERLCRAKIDLERYRCLIRMDELMQEEQRIRRTMSQRGGILGILLHRTIDHKPSKPVPLPPELKLQSQTSAE